MMKNLIKIAIKIGIAVAFYIVINNVLNRNWITASILLSSLIFFMVLYRYITNYIEEKEHLLEIIGSIDENIIVMRLKSVCLWYLKKSYLNKYSYYLFSVLIIVFTSAIPIINQTNLFNNSLVIVSIISAISSVLATLITVLNMKKIWYNSRLTLELIKEQIFLYKCKTKEYSNSNEADIIFAENISNIISMERNKWHNMIIKNNEVSVPKGN